MRNSLIMLMVMLCGTVSAALHHMVIARKNVSSAVDYSQDANCVFAARMNGDATGDVVDSGSTNDLAVFAGHPNTSTTVPSGYSGNSRQFLRTATDEGADADAGSTEFDITGDLSMVAWVHLQELPSVVGADGVILSKYDDTGQKRSWRMLTDTGTDTFKFTCSASPGSGNTALKNTTAFATGTWYHVAMVHDNTGNQMKLYVDGVNTTNTTHSGGLSSETPEFTIGRQNASDANGIKMLIDEVGIFNDILTPTEVGNIMTNGLFGDNGSGD